MTCVEAPACRALLDEATDRAPDRRTTSDGICASAAHHQQNPDSDHEPHVIVHGVGYATGVDLSDDKAGGMDADEFAEVLRLCQDWRIKYVICNRRMFSSYPAKGYPAWFWRPYDGPNPHETHTHVSIVPEAIFCLDPWWKDAPMTPAELDEIVRRVKAETAAEVTKDVIDALAPTLNKIAESVAGRRKPTPGDPETKSMTGRIDARVIGIEKVVGQIADAVVPPT